MTSNQLAALTAEDIDTSDLPDLDETFWKHARVVMPEDRGKVQNTANFNADMVNWFKQQGRGYQARMNAVPRSFYEARRDGGQ